jgi:hypothetical protein
MISLEISKYVKENGFPDMLSKILFLVSLSSQKTLCYPFIDFQGEYKTQVIQSYTQAH